MSETASISSGIAARYATAVFDLAKENKAIPALEADADALIAALAVSADLRDLLSSPVVTREDQQASIKAIAAKMHLSGLVSNTLQLMAQNRRLFVLPQMLANVAARISEEKGEIVAEVTSATALNADQHNTLSASLQASAGKTVKLKTSVDETLIGGLIVRLGSTMIDASVKAKLAALQNAMKEVG